MGSETTDAIEVAAEALCRRDLDAFIEVHSPDAEICPLIASVEGDSYKGHEGLRRFWAELHDAFDEWCPRPEESRRLESASVTRMRLRARGKDSEVAIERVVWAVAATDGGRLTAWRIHTSEEEAVATALHGGP